MGLTPSKPDPYILRVDDKRATMQATIKPTRTTTPSSTSSTSLTKTGSSAVLPINSSSSSTAPSTSAGENYTYGKPTAGSSLSSQNRAMSSKHLATNGPVIRQHSQTNSNTGAPAGIAASEKVTPGMSKKQLSQRHQPPSSSSAGGDPSASLKHAASSMKLTTTGVHGIVNARCSVEYPWLLKQGNMQGLGLHDIEMGRIIGRGLMGTVRICKTKSSSSSSGNNSSSSSSSSKNGDKSAEKGGKNADINGNNTSNSKYFVLKAVKKDYISKHNDLRHVLNEKEALRAVTSPFCVKLFGTFQDRHYIYFALEFVPGGELFHRLGKKKAFSPAVAKFYATEVCAALDHVQSLGYVYRDLKPENVILDEEGHCKLVDFGFAIRCTGSDKMQTLCGTPAYLSPEQLDGKLTQGYTKVVDWWSFGVLVYELLTGKTPFCRNNRESHYEIFLRILQAKISFPMNFDASSKLLISQLCHPQLDKRLCECDDVKAHVYFEVPWAAVQNQALVPPFVPKLKHVGDARYFEQYAEEHYAAPVPTQPPSGGTNKGSHEETKRLNHEANALSKSEFFDF